MIFDVDIERLHLKINTDQTFVDTMEMQSEEFRLIVAPDIRTNRFVIVCQCIECWKGIFGQCGVDG